MFSLDEELAERMATTASERAKEVAEEQAREKEEAERKRQEEEAALAAMPGEAQAASVLDGLLPDTGGGRSAGSVATGTAGSSSFSLASLNPGIST